MRCIIFLDLWNYLNFSVELAIFFMETFFSLGNSLVEARCFADAAGSVFSPPLGISFTKKTAGFVRELVRGPPEVLENSPAATTLLDFLEDFYFHLSILR